MIRLTVGQPRVVSYNPDRRKRLLSTPKRPGRSWANPAVYSVGTGGSYHGVKHSICAGCYRQVLFFILYE